MSETIESLTKKFESMQEELKTNGKQLIGQLLKEQLASVPEVAAVRWTQYTPYFNDGEPCTFSVNEELDYKLVGDVDDTMTCRTCGAKYLKRAGGGEQFCSNDGRQLREAKEFVDTYDLKDGLRQRCEKVADTLFGIPDDFFLIAFGDHVQITATKTADGGVEIAVDEYEHD